MKLPRLWHGRRRAQLVLLVANGLAQAACALGIAHTLARAVDASTQGALPWSSLGIALGLGALFAALRWHERHVAERLAQGFVHRIRARLLHKIGRVDARAWQRQSRGGLLLRFFGDMTAVGSWISLGLARSLVALALVVGLAAGLALRDPVFALLPLALGLPAVLLALRSARGLDDAVLELRSRRAALATRVSERIVADPITASGGDLTLLRRGLLRQSGRVRDAAISARTRAAGVTAALEFIALLGPPVAVCMLAASGAGNAPTAGEVTALLSLAALLTNPLRDLSRVFECWRRGRIALGKLASFLALRELRSGARRFAADPPAMAVALRHVLLDAAHPPIDVEIAAGEHVQCQLPRGPLRNALLALLLRAADPLDGAVEYDGRPARRYRLDALRRSVAVVGPGTLVPGARQLDATQRLVRAIQRAVARRPRLLVIDGIDGGGAQELRRAVLDALENTDATVLLLGDDPSWRRLVDRSVVLLSDPTHPQPDIRSLLA